MVWRSLLLIAILSLGYSNASLAQSPTIRFVDERGKTLTQVEAATPNGDLYLSIEALRDAFDPNLKQQYRSLTRQLTLNLKGVQVRLWIGKLSVTVDPDGRTISLSRPPRIIAGQRMLPLEFYTELIPQIYDLEVFHNPVLQTIHIKEQTAPLSAFPPVSSTGQHTEFLVVLDPGHGGSDLGYRGNTEVLEKDIVLNLAKQIEDVCRHNQIRVLLTRDADVERRPTERIDTAKRHHGKLFLSLHCNASFSPKVDGLHLYVNNPLGKLQSGSPSTVPDGTSQHDTTLKALSQEDFLMQSRQFASILQKELEPFSPLPIPLTEFPLATLSGVYMPAILIETGYLSNETDEARLTDTDSLASIATAIAQAIERYIAKVDSVGETVNGK